MHYFILFVCTAFLFLSGCGGSSVPADFPKVFPLKVSVVNGSETLSDVQVQLYPVETGKGFASSASTDASGTAQVHTAQGAYSVGGIPAGEYVVTVADIIKIDEGVTPEQKVKMSRAELNKLDEETQKKRAAYKRKVPESLCKTGKIEQRSPIHFTVKEGANELKIDVAEYKK